MFPYPWYRPLLTGTNIIIYQVPEYIVLLLIAIIPFFFAQKAATRGKNRAFEMYTYSN